MKVAVQLTADGRNLTQVVGQAKAEVIDFAARAEAAGRRAGAGLDQASASAARLTPAMGGAQVALRSVEGAAQGMAGRLGVAGTMLAGLGTVALGVTAAVGALATAFVLSANAADRLDLMRARLELATGSAQGAAGAMQRLFDQAQATGTSLEAGAASFVRFSLAARNVGKTTEETLRFADAVNKLGRISGATGSELAAGAQQLAQALASGRLQGDELRSIMENLPMLARAIAEGLGVSVGALRQMGAEGQLTADKVFDAILKQTQQIDRDYARLPQTVDQALTRVGNAWERLIGNVGKQLDSNRTLAALINLMAGGLTAAANFAAPMDELARATKAAADSAAMYARALEQAQRLAAQGGTPNQGALEAARQRAANDNATALTLEETRRLGPRAAEAAGRQRQFEETQRLARAAQEVVDKYREENRLLEQGGDALKRHEAREKAIAEVLKAAGVESLKQLDLTTERGQAIKAAADAAGQEAERALAIAAANQAATRAAQERASAQKQAAAEARRAEAEAAAQQDRDRAAARRRGDALVAAQAGRERGAARGLGELESAAGDAASGGRAAEIRAAERQIENALLDETGRLTRQLTAAERQRIAAAIDLNRQNSIAARVLEELRGPQEKHKETVATLDRLYRDNLITLDEWQRAKRDADLAALDSATDLESGISRGLLRIERDMGDMASVSERLVTGAFESAEDAVVKFAQTGKFSIRDFASFTVGEMARIGFRNLANAAPGIGRWLLDSFGQAFTPDPSMNAAQMWVATAHAGGVAGQSRGPGRHVPASAFTLAPRLHAGGMVGAGLAPGEVPIVAMAGEEVLTASDPRHRNNARGGGVVVNIIDQRGAGAPAVETRERGGPDGQRVIDVIIAEAVTRATGEGRLDRSMETNYGLRRQPGRR